VQCKSRITVRCEAVETNLRHGNALAVTWRSGNGGLGGAGADGPSCGSGFAGSGNGGTGGSGGAGGDGGGTVGPSIGIFRAAGSTATVDSATTISVGSAGAGGLGGLRHDGLAQAGQAGTAVDTY
jgi:hypothetical protein